MKEQTNKIFGITEFTILAAAKRYADKCIKLNIVMLGDNSNYWVVSFADAQKLLKLGYELAV